MARMTLLVVPEPSLASARSDTNFTPGATPLASAWSPPMRPPMCVPCPYGSSAFAAAGFFAPPVKSRVVLMRVARPPSCSRPESITATVTPFPVSDVVSTGGLYVTVNIGRYDDTRLSDVLTDHDSKSL